MITVFDNVLDNHLVDEMERELSSPNFPWFFAQSTVIDPEEHIRKYCIDKHQFTHVMFYENKINSVYYDLAMKLIEPLNLKYKSIKRIKANFVSNCGFNDYNHFQPIHVDGGEDEMTLLYYANESDGDTWFFEKMGKNIDKRVIDKVYPKRGRAIWFPSNIPHAGSHPINYETRFVINYIFEV